jgi:hypothetical protein
VFRPFLPVSRNTAVLYTTTDRTFSNLAHNVVHIHGFTHTDSVRYLHTTGLRDEPGADQLAAHLNGLPLALADAAHAITTEQLTYPQYTQRLRTQPLRQALPHRPGPDRYPHSVDAALARAVEHCLSTATFAPWYDNTVRDMAPLIRQVLDHLIARGAWASTVTRSSRPFPAATPTTSKKPSSTAAITT